MCCFAITPLHFLFSARRSANAVTLIQFMSKLSDLHVLAAKYTLAYTTSDRINHV
jgi:hypothetical protein